MTGALGQFDIAALLAWQTVGDLAEVRLEELCKRDER